jgi:toxin ParE1/3/4
MVWRTTDLADEDIADIETYGTLTFGRSRAEQYVDDLFSAFDVLAALPRMAQEHDDLPGLPRIYHFRSHKVIYAIEDEDVVIVRVLHASRDIARHL